MRKVQFPVSKSGNSYVYPDTDTFFSKTKIIGSNMKADYTGSKNSGEIADYVPVAKFQVTWVSAVLDDGIPTPVIYFDVDHSAEYAMMVVKAGDVATALNAIKITATNTGPAGDYVVPIKHVLSGQNDKEIGPRLAMTVSKTVSDTVTPTIVFPNAGFYLVDKECLNEKYPDAYDIKPLKIRVVG